jgi:hypothetical protein
MTTVHPPLGVLILAERAGKEIKVYLLRYLRVNVQAFEYPSDPSRPAEIRPQDAPNGP